MNQKRSRLIIVVLDGAGVGNAPDAAEYGDEGSNTVGNIARSLGGIDLPNLQGMGLGNLTDIEGVAPNPNSSASYGVMRERSRGKDTITGHWEMMGIVTEREFPTYPHGFPKVVMDELEARVGAGTLGNKAASGTEIIEEMGEEHIRTGRPIVYTSADSVFQIAAHEKVVPVKRLYEMCLIARGILTGEHNVARVIARPFVGEPGSFTRTEWRKDFSIPPPSETAMDALRAAGFSTAGIGKIGDIFSMHGLDSSAHTSDNADTINKTIEAIGTSESGLIFVNMVDFDSKYGHRNDPAGFAFGLREFDERIPEIQGAMRDNDLLVITADHGVDPTTPSTDHSREMVPLLVWGREAARVDLGRRDTFADLAATVSEIFGLPAWPVGKSFAGEVLVF